MHVVFCVRGQRGPEINERDAEALAIWSRTVPIHALHITSATDSADERNSVTAEERSAFIRVIERSGIEHRYHDRLDDAISAALGDAGEHDLVLLLGAQGMDAGAGIVSRVLDSGDGRGSSG
jgi:UDP-N-acetylmuramoyl-L-alanyl-D-glutamate--2,6-diaminopimelate ligase